MFNTIDCFALDVFVVDGWTGEVGSIEMSLFVGKHNESSHDRVLLLGCGCCLLDHTGPAHVICTTWITRQ